MTPRSISKNFPFEPKYATDEAGCMSDRWLRTFVMLKPDAYEKKLVGPILTDLHQEFEILGMRQNYFSQKEVHELYRVHEKKFFYDRLEQFIISGPCLMLFVRAEWLPVRDFAMKTRDKYGVTEADLPRNLIHSSDSADAALWEVGHIFPGFSNFY